MVNTKTPRRMRNIIIGLVVVIVLAVVGGVIGYLVTRNKKTSHNGITIDPNLHQSFWGINYTPLKSQYPGCGSKQQDITDDIKVLSQLTSRLRLYGMDCNQADYTLQAIQDLKVNMQVILTIWVDGNQTTYQRQYDQFFSVLQRFGPNQIYGVSVGNEAFFRKEISHQQLYSRISDVRQKIQGLGYHIPVTTSDLGSNYTPELIGQVDFSMANVHPYFAGTLVKDAANWTFSYFQENIARQSVAAGKDAIISEVGWATQGDPDQGAVASVPNLQTFLDTFLCQANQQKVKYFWFEAMDEPWKTQQFTLLEGNWGLLTTDRKPKATIPNCQAS
ncbi:glycoside hydrolase [Basidiobolus meristosporus CBS 931.73]|uniref:glucan endo-1,3-beta-D-glucosidase n=1 Tax=Basidiobolus meristosporus CBS 931.73 TaxID=1314790 RepID=A0A1Y1Z8P5_9FUNG|nr:glycoside hydrolase [Basidiobolus meristosporus CBS 931.73]|eukprot:ORY06474.1 glycoside hydrolase [Basidiobolus meristosporus CBS 931.73]